MFCDLNLFRLKQTTSKTPGLIHSVVLWPQGQHFKTCLMFQFCQCCQCCFFFFFMFLPWFNNSYLSVAGNIKNVEAGVALSLLLGRHTKAWIWTSPKIRRGRWEGGPGLGIHVNPWLIHVNVWQKPLQYCKVISLQLIKINEKKRSVHLGTPIIMIPITIIPLLMNLPSIFRNNLSFL